MQFEQHGICNICSIRHCYHGGTCGRDLNNARLAKPGNVYVFYYIKLSPHSIGKNDRAYPWIFFIIKVLLKQILLRLFQLLRQNHCILITISPNILKNANKPNYDLSYRRRLSQSHFEDDLERFNKLLKFLKWTRDTNTISSVSLFCMFFYSELSKHWIPV